ncbi:MAG: invasion associated locus B family protein [Pseudomonadota bacterium]
MKLFGSIGAFSIVNRRIQSIAATALLAAGISMAADTDSAQAQDIVPDTWTVDCQAPKCVLYYVTAGMRLYIGEELEGDRLLMEIRLGPSLPGTPVTMRIDTGYSAGLIVTECADETNCRLILDISENEQLIEQLKQGGDGMTAYVIDEGQTIILVPFTLSGFTAAYNELMSGG